MPSNLLSQYPELSHAFKNASLASSYLNQYIVLAFTGSRHWKDKSLVGEVVLTAKKVAAKENKTLLCLHGDCPTGLDYMVRYLCEVHGILQIPIPAPWKIGKKAGPLRNTLLLQTAQRLGATHLLAFPEEGSKGTKDCMEQAYDFAIRVINFGLVQA
jgi:hypothetical protein